MWLALCGERMKLYYPLCTTLVGDITNGSHIRKGAIMACAKCFARCQLAGETMEKTRQQERQVNCNMPELMEIFK